MNGLMVRIAALVLAIIVVAACAGGAAATAEPIAEATTAVTAASTPSAASVPTATPKPTPTPEPTPDLAAIAAAYLALSDRFNAAATPVFDEFAAREHSEEEYIALHQQVVDAYAQAITDLDAIDFPPDLRDEVVGIRAAWVEVRHAFEAVTKDTTFDASPIFDEKVSEYGKLANAVREYLGLPPRPTDPPS